MGVKVREKIKGSGEFWVFINYRGKRVSKKVGSEEAAEKARTQIEARLALGLPIEEKKPKAPTLRDQFRRFKEGYLKTAVKPATRTSYTGSFERHILPVLGDYRLDEMTRDKVIEFIGTPVDKKLARDSVRIILAALRVLLSEAVESKLIPSNPAARLSKFMRGAPRRTEEIQSLTREEMSVFLETVRKDRLAKKHYPLFLLACHTGLRSGELAGLQWGDVDERNKHLVVRRNFSHGRVGTTKTDRIRKVDLSDEALKALQALRRQRQEDSIKDGHGGEICDWIFSNKDGQIIQFRSIKRIFKRILGKAGLAERRFHDLRHSYASILLSEGISPAYVKEQLGHSTIKLTVDLYGHWIPGQYNRDAINRMPKASEATKK